MRNSVRLQRQPNLPSHNRTRCYRGRISIFLRYNRWETGSGEAAICWISIAG